MLRINSWIVELLTMVPQCLRISEGGVGSPWNMLRLETFRAIICKMAKNTDEYRIW